MAGQVSSQQPSLDHPGQLQPVAAIIDDLFQLASSRDLDAMLNKALRITIDMLRAEAGSVLFQTQTVKNIRSGPFRQEVLNRIEQWEMVIGKRLQEKNWTVPASETLPISVSRLSDHQIIVVNVPLVQETNVVGALSFALPPNQSLTEPQHHLLERMARGLGQVAATITELQMAQHRLNQISIFYDVGQALITTFDTAQLLSETMELATNVIDAGAASIVLIDEASNELVFKVSHGSSGPMLRHQRIPMDEGIAGWVARNGRPVIANNARGDARFSQRVDVRTGFLTQSIAAVPLKIKGRTIGVLEVLNKYSDSGFNQEDLQLMSFIATQAAIAIENSRIYDRLRHERDHIIKIEQDVRRELIRSLQGGPVHHLTAISMGLDHLDRLSAKPNPEIMQNEISALRNLVHRAARDAKNILFDFNAVLLESQGLVAALDKYVSQLRLAESFQIHFKPIKHLPYSTKVEKVIFSIIQEAINNIRHHAKADNVWLSLDVKRGQFMTVVKDDGCGFDLHSVESHVQEQLTFGLLHMKERAAAIGAALEIVSKTNNPNQGTTIQLSLPWESPGPHSATI